MSLWIIFFYLHISFDRDKNKFLISLSRRCFWEEKDKKCNESVQKSIFLSAHKEISLSRRCFWQEKDKKCDEWVNKKKSKEDRVIWTFIIQRRIVCVFVLDSLQITKLNEKLNALVTLTRGNVSLVTRQSIFPINKQLTH